MEDLVEGVLARLESDGGSVLFVAVVSRHQHRRGGDVTSRGCDSVAPELGERLPRQFIQIDDRVLVVIGDRVHVPFAAGHLPVADGELVLIQFDRVEPVGVAVPSCWLAKIPDLHDDRCRVGLIGVVEEDSHLLDFCLLLLCCPCDGYLVHFRHLHVERKAYRKPLLHFIHRFLVLAPGKNDSRHECGRECSACFSHCFFRLIKGYSILDRIPFVHLDVLLGGFNFSYFAAGADGTFHDHSFPP